MTTVKNLKMRENKRSEIEYIKIRATEQIRDVEVSFNEAKIILDKVNEVTDFLYAKELSEDVTITFDRWGKYINISDVKDIKIFNNFVIALTELYNEGEKSVWGNDGVKYSFEKKSEYSFESVYVTLSVKTTVTGCTIVKEMVTIPERVIPEHKEEKIVLKCED